MNPGMTAARDLLLKATVPVVSKVTGPAASRLWSGDATDQFTELLSGIVAEAIEASLGDIDSDDRKALVAPLLYARPPLEDALDADRTAAEAIGRCIELLVRPMDENEVDGTGHLTSLGLAVDAVVADATRRAIGVIRARGLRGEVLLAPLAGALEPRPGEGDGPVRDGLRTPTSWFRGRRGEVEDISALLAGADGIAVVNIVGMPGVGKSALADEVAHALAPSFTRLLRVKLPADVDRPTYLRDQVVDAFGIADRRFLASGPPVLLVLDDLTQEQDLDWVAHLPSGSAVLATSWAPQLPGARIVRIEPVGRDDARAILAARSGRGDLDGADAVLAACDGLPLALVIAAALLARRPTWSWADVGGRLGVDAIGAMDRHAAPEPGPTDVFSLCYAELSPVEAEAFRLLARLPTPTIDVALAGRALDDGFGWSDGVDVVEALVDLALLEPDRAGYVAVHRLLAEFAAVRHQRDGDVGRAERFDAGYLHAQLAQADDIVHQLRWGSDG